MPQNQQNREWFDLHNKHITASRFGDVMADPSTKRYKTYQNELTDYILGVPYIEDDKPWFRHGKEWEAQARGLYELKTGHTVEQDFFIVHPKLLYVGVSPDGYVIAHDINVEIKSHKGIPENLKPREKLPSSHKPQVQGQMWCTGRKQTDFVDFYKDESTGKADLTILRVEPDLEYFDRLESACVGFWAKIKERLKG